MMNNIFRTLASAATTAAILLPFCSSCIREDGPEGGRDESGKAKMTVILRSAGEMETRTELQTSDEKKVTSIDVFVFSGTILEAHERATGDGITECGGLEVSYGEKTVWVFCNYRASRLSGITTIAGCEAVTSSFTENARDAFVMSGSTTYTVSASNANVPVDVRRDVAKVQITSAPTFSGVCSGGTLQGIYLVNIPKTYGDSVVLTSSSASDAWNFRNAVATGADSEVASMTSSSTWSTALYGMPNASPEAATASDGNAAGEDYVTKLVLKCSIGGNTYWYPLGLPGMAPNKYYEVSGINIFLLGSSNPNEYSTSSSIKATVNVLDWDAGTVDATHIPGSITLSVSPAEVTKDYNGGSQSVTVTGTSTSILGGSTTLPASGYSLSFSTDGGTTWSDTAPEGLAVSGSAPTYTFTLAAASTVQTTTGDEWPASGVHTVYRGSAGSPVDLSKEDVFGNANAGGVMTTANTYVIHSPGTYMIPLVYGNAITDGVANVNSYSTTGLPSAGKVGCLDLFHNAYDTGISSPYIETDIAASSHTLGNALLVWEDAENLVSVNSALQTHNGIKYLVFEVPSSSIAYGNAVVGVRDDADNIVWSWQVWVTASDLYDVNTEYGSGVTLLSENIGQGHSFQIVDLRPGFECLARFTWTDGTVTKTATIAINRTESSSGPSATYTTSSYYQWGRKDPFPYSTVTYGDAPYSASTSTAKITSGTSIKNPNVFQRRNTSDDWCSDHTYFYNMWNMQSYQGSSDLVTVKTVYDPSPAGYCIARKNTWDGFDFTTSYFIDLNNDGNIDSSDFDIYHGLYFKRNASDTEGYFMPASGFINYLNGNCGGLGVSGFSWLSSPSGSTARYLSFTNSHINSSDPENSTMRTYTRSGGESVRPQKIQSL